MHLGDQVLGSEGAQMEDPAVTLVRGDYFERLNIDPERAGKCGDLIPTVSATR